MATGTANLTPSNASDAAFRAWGSPISGFFNTFGWNQTADTGQINWTTVTVPVASTTAAGYEIWGFDDTLQATAPIYTKIEYGSGSAATSPSMWITFGTGTDGIGNLTGPISVRQQITGSSYTTNTLGCYFSGDTNRIAVMLFVNGTGASTNVCQYFSIERTKDASGNDTNLGAIVIMKSSTTIAQMFWNRTTGTPANGLESGFTAIGPTGSTAKNGTQVAVFPIFPNNAGIFINPPLSMLIYVNADIVALGAVSFVIYGASHTYMPFGSTSWGVSNMLYRNSGTPAPLMRWE